MAQAAEETESPIAEMAYVLSALSEQAARWQAELTRAQFHVRSITGQQSCAARPGQHWETAAPLSAGLVDGLIAEGARRIAHVHGGDALLLVPESRTVQLRELVSRPLHAAPRRARAASRHRIRTTAASMREMLLIDDTVALIPSRDAEEPPAVAVVRQPLVVSQLIHFFDAAWMQSTPFDEDAPTRFRAGAEAEMKRRIIQLLAEGAKDEAMARRLGISLRTCRRHVAEILEQLDSSSRFQAGARAALLGLLPAAPPTPR